MGFPGMITSVPHVTNKVKLKIAKRIINTMREECTGCVGSADSALSSGPLAPVK